jgi:SAM-dependent methyltransferase
MTDMASTLPTPTAHGQGEASDWVQRWSHLVQPAGTVLDLACGHGRHLRWFAERGHAVTGVDRSADAIQAVSSLGEAVLADIENGPWPLMQGYEVRQFDAVIVTNYLWRPLFERISQSLAPGGILIYETFALGNETVGKPSRPDFLLQPAELLRAFTNLHIIGFEQGFLVSPPRFVQRLVASRQPESASQEQTPARYTL